MGNRLLLAVLSVPVLAGCAGIVQDPEAPREPGTWARAEGGVWYGPVDGFTQIPKEGKTGTSSPRRPTLKEMGFRSAAEPDVRLTVGKGAHEFFLEDRMLRLSGSTRLDAPLTTHGRLFPAGDDVGAKVDVDSYWLGYGHRFDLSSGEEDGFLTLVPRGGIHLWRFGYSLGDTSGPSTTRSFTHASPFLGAGLEWEPGGPFSLRAEVLSTIPAGSSTWIVPVKVEAGWHLWGEEGAGGRLVLGLGYERTDFKDSQGLPNHVRLTAGPMALLGLRVDF